MPADAIEQLGDRLVAEIGQVCPVQRRVARQPLWKIEAEWNLALEPGFYGVSVGGEHLRRCVGGERGDVLVAGLGHERSVFGGAHRRSMRAALDENEAHGE